MPIAAVEARPPCRRPPVAGRLAGRHPPRPGWSPLLHRHRRDRRLGLGLALGPPPRLCGPGLIPAAAIFGERAAPTHGNRIRPGSDRVGRRGRVGFVPSTDSPGRIGFVSSIVSTEIGSRLGSFSRRPPRPDWRRPAAQPGAGLGSFGRRGRAGRGPSRVRARDADSCLKYYYVRNLWKFGFISHLSSAAGVPPHRRFACRMQLPEVGSGRSRVQRPRSPAPVATRAERSPAVTLGKVEISDRLGPFRAIPDHAQSWNNGFVPGRHTSPGR